jgi:ribulose 1,5-bisphosphate carboxylase large subunit-like protein
MKKQLLLLVLFIATGIILPKSVLGQTGCAVINITSNATDNSIACPGTLVTLSFEQTGFDSENPTVIWYIGGQQIGEGVNINTNPQTTTTYHVIANGSVGGLTCVVESEITITVNYPITLTSSATTVCFGNQVTLTAANTGGSPQYSWSPVGTGTGASVTVTPQLPQTTYTVTVTNIAGCTSTNAITINVLSLPIVNAGSDVTINCSNPSATIGSTAVAGNTYAWSPATGLDDFEIPQPIASGNTTQTYTLTVTNTANGCTASDAVTVIADKSPPFVFAGNDVTINCSNPSETIGSSSVAGNIYAWSPETGINNANIAQPIASGNTTQTYTVTVTGSNGCTAIDAVTVTANKNPPSANAGNDVTINCSNPSETIGSSSIAGNTYSWSPSTGLSATNIAQPIANANTTQTYTLTVANTANGCTATDAVTVTANKTPPAANAGSDVTINCTNPSATIGSTSVAGNTYAWSPATGLSATNDAQPTASGNTTQTYTVIVTGTNGCTASDAVLVTANKTPPIAQAFANPGTVCPNQITELSATGGNTYVWSTGQTGTPIQITSSSEPEIYNYTVTVTNTSNGCSNSASTSVNVVAAPSVTASNNNPCTGGNLTLSASTTGGSGFTYAWSGPNSFTSTQQNPTVTGSATNANNGTYTVTVTNTNNCTALASTIVTVTAGLTPNITGNSSFCPGASTTLNAGSGYSSYLWNNGATSQTITVSTANTYTVTVSNAAGCSGSASVIISQSQVPTANAGSNSPVCSGGNLNLSSSGGNQYSWSGPNSYSSTQQNPDVTNPISGLYTVTVTNAAGCTASVAVNVTVHPSPSVTASNNNPCTGGNLTLNASATGGSGFTYTWNGPNSYSSTQQNPTVTANATSTNNGTYTVTVTNSNNCIGTASTSC